MEEDIQRNYADDVVILTGNGILRGHDGLRELAKRLRAIVEDGADCYLIRDGRIVAQTIHYTISAQKSSR